MTGREQYVRFYLPTRYFQTRPCPNGMARDKCVTILLKSFGTKIKEIHEIMKRCPEGFHVVCTVEQFGRFIINRCKLGDCINGIRDLCPEFVTRQETDRTSRTVSVLSHKIGLSPSHVRQVLEALDTWSLDDAGDVALYVVPSHASW